MSVKDLQAVTKNWKESYTVSLFSFSNWFVTLIMAIILIPTPSSLIEEKKKKKEKTTNNSNMVIQRMGTFFFS